MNFSFRLFGQNRPTFPKLVQKARYVIACPVLARLTLRKGFLVYNTFRIILLLKSARVDTSVSTIALLWAGKVRKLPPIQDPEVCLRVGSVRSGLVKLPTS